MTQTTLSVDDTSEIISILYYRFPNIIGPKKYDICYATFNRQVALKNLVKLVEIILVIGSNSSSNAKSLVKLAYRMGKITYLINNADDIQKDWLKEIKNIGITSGASISNVLVDQVIDKLHELSVDNFFIEEMVAPKENMFFDIPKMLKTVDVINIK